MSQTSTSNQNLNSSPLEEKKIRSFNKSDQEMSSDNGYLGDMNDLSSIAKTEPKVYVPPLPINKPNYNFMNIRDQSPSLYGAQFQKKGHEQYYNHYITTDHANKNTTLTQTFMPYLRSWY